MNTTRKLVTLASSVWLLSMSQTVSAQPAPAAPAAPPKAQTPEKPGAPAAPDSAAAPGAQPTKSDAPNAEVTKPTPGPEAPTTTLPATTAAPGATFDASATMPRPVAIPPAPAPIIEPAPAPPPTHTLELAEETWPAKIAIGNNGWLKIGGLAQTWLAVEDGTNIATDAANRKVDTTMYFRLRRAYFTMAGEVVKNRVGFNLVLDGAKAMRFSSVNTGGTLTGYAPPSDTSILLDAMITFKSCVADVSIGQWKSPISFEANTSSAELLLPERAHTTRYFGDNYDAGIRVDKKFEIIKYSLQLLQGAPGANQMDNNRQKEIALRLEFTPMKGIMVGGAGLVSVGQRDSQDSTREVAEADVAVEHEGFLARGELLWQWKGVDKQGIERTKARGMAATIAHTFAKMIQPVVRLSYLDVDKTTDGQATSMPLYAKYGFATDEVRAYEFGINYLIDGKFAKIMANYSYFDLDNVPYRQQFILAGQAAF